MTISVVLLVELGVLIPTILVSVAFTPKAAGQKKVLLCVVPLQEGVGIDVYA